jgi:hypothetical protein
MWDVADYPKERRIFPSAEENIIGPRPGKGFLMMGFAGINYFPGLSCGYCKK